MTTTTTSKRTSRASRAAAQAKADQAQAPEQQPQVPERVQPEQAAAEQPQVTEQVKPEGAAKAKKAPMGPSGYRVRFGTSDAEILTAIKSYAQEHYESGWDIVVEAMTDEEILKDIGWATSAKGAIAKLTPMVRVHADVRADQMAAAKNA